MNCIQQHDVVVVACYIQSPESQHRQFIENHLHDYLRRLLPGFGFEVVKTHRLGKICHMPLTLEQIVEETRQMPDEVVAELVDRILIARHGGVESSVDSAWKTEASRRIAEIESGQVKGVPLEESLARARKIAGL